MFRKPILTRAISGINHSQEVVPLGVNGIFGRDGAISGSSYGVWVWLVGISLTWVVLGGEGGSGFDAWFGVSGEGAGVVVSEFGLEKDC